MSDILWPNGTAVRPAITSPYGRRAAPVAGASTFHRGTDFVGYRRVRAIAAGVVVQVGTPKGWAAGGIQVWIQHDGFLTRSMHLAKGSPVVHEGDHVDAGHDLGEMGKTGNVSGVHHHLEVVVDGIQVDPVPFITSRLAAPSGGATVPADPSIVWEDDMAEMLTSSGGQSLGIQGHVVPLISEEEVRSIVITPGRVEMAQSVHARVNAIVGGRKSDDVIVNVIGGNGTRYVWSGGILTELAHQQTIDQLVAMGAGAVNWELDEVNRILAKQS